MTGEQLCFLLERIDRLCRDPESVATSERYIASVRYIENAMKAIMRITRKQQDFLDTATRMILCISCCARVLIKNKYPAENDTAIDELVRSLCFLR